MHKRISSLILTTTICCLFGCSQTNITDPEQISGVNNGMQDQQDLELKWSPYSDPKADANFAIEKKNFALLAFAGRATSFPGIDGESFALQKQCGYRLLANSSDALKSQSELSVRKQLYQYAKTYNQVISAACQKHRLSKNSNLNL